MSDAPERIWICPFGGNWSDRAGGTQGEEYIRADLIPQWQPIETAPKDALLLGFEDGAMRLIYREIEQWYQVGATIEPGWFAPTHWMPLPSTPSKS